MHSKGLARYILVTAMGFAGVAVAQNGTGPRQADVDKTFKDELVKQNIVGGAVAVVRDGVIIHSAGYGHTSLTRNVKVSDETVFRWASISKPLTAVAALQVDESITGFEIEDKISDHVDYWNYGGSKDAITIKHALSNRSGIIHYNNSCAGNSNPGFSQSAHGNGAFDPQNAIEVFGEQSLCFAPNADYSYSTFGFSLVAAAIEEGSGQSYNDWVMNQVAAPLGMTSLRQATGDSHGFAIECGALKNAVEHSKSYVLAGGGWESNVVDLAKFANGILQESLLSDTDRLWTEETGNDNSYRLGIRTNSSNTRAFHGGAHEDTRTFMHLYPGRSDKLGVVVYLNGAHGDPERTAKRVAMALGVTWTDVSEEARIPLCDDNCGGSFSAVWRRTKNDVIQRLGMSQDDFVAEWRYLRSLGYYLDDFETRNTSANTVSWDGIFRKGEGGNAMWRGFDREAFNVKWQEQSARGFRLVDLETYKIGSKRYWAGLFRPGLDRYAMYRYYSTDDFGIKRKELAEDGLKLIDVEAFTEHGNLKWAGVWIAGNDGKLNRNYTTDDFGELRQARRDNGWKLIDIERYKVGREVRWAGVWEASPQTERLNRNYNLCGVKNNDDEWMELGILNRHEQWRNGGFELIDWERH